MTNSKFLAVVVSLCTFALIGTSATATAQGQWGVEGGYNFKRESVMLGGRFVVPINPKVKLVPQLAVDFEIDELVLDVDFQLTKPETALYLLGGVNYANSDAGMNIGGGLLVDITKKTKGFLELKYVAFGWDGWIFKGGVLF